mmetsp:Transcript_35040/g.100908  ORF Transcript_35040/g.100908 Transcript_35040/m.100908 type:complete len:297 (-) Transcript_35040:607-1497(-)
MRIRAVAAVRAEEAPPEAIGAPQCRGAEALAAGVEASAAIGQHKIAIAGSHLQIRLEVEDEAAEPGQGLEVEHEAVVRWKRCGEPCRIVVQLPAVLESVQGAGEVRPLRSAHAACLGAHPKLRAGGAAIRVPGPAMEVAAVRREAVLEGSKRQLHGAWPMRGLAAQPATEAEFPLPRHVRLGLLRVAVHGRESAHGDEAAIDLQGPIRLTHAGDVAEPGAASVRPVERRLSRALRWASPPHAREQLSGVARVGLQEHKGLLAICALIDRNVRPRTALHGLRHLGFADRSLFMALRR